ncbi:MAG TPA: twin-arginine translocase subunit TatC [Trueperaceae bacterium]
MTLIDHFEELRTRLFIALGAWIVGSGVAFYFLDRLLGWIQEPLPPNMSLTAFGFLEPFLVAMQIASFFGLVLAAPIIGGQIWGFVAPGLYPEERRWAVPFILLTAIAFSGGVVFARYVVLPFSIPIILGFLGPEVAVLPSIGDYISKVLLIMAVFGLIFEMPVVGFLLARLGIVRARQLTSNRKWAVVVGLLVAAIITPTADPFNFGLVAIPLVVLYEVTVIVVRLSQKKEFDEREDPEPTS